MGTVILVIDVILAIMLVALVLVQRSDGALGSLGGGASSMMSTRARGNFLTRTTWIVAFSFMACSLLLVLINKPVADNKLAILEDGAIAQVPVAATTDNGVEMPASNKVNTQSKEGKTKPVSSPVSAKNTATKKEPSKPVSRPVSAPVSAE